MYRKIHPPRVLVFLWLENQTILLIMQYNFCFAFGNVFYLTNWLKGSEEAIFDLESEISRNEVQKASCSANQQCLCNLERFEVKEAHWTANQSRCEGAGLENWRKAVQAGAARRGVTPVSHRCHTGVTCLLLGPPAAYIRVRPHALPSVPPKLLWTWEGRVECTRTTRGTRLQHQLGQLCQLRLHHLQCSSNILKQAR